VILLLIVIEELAILKACRWGKDDYFFIYEFDQDQEHDQDYDFNAGYAEHFLNI
jgi:hypothetical protein